MSAREQYPCSFDMETHKKITKRREKMGNISKYEYIKKLVMEDLKQNGEPEPTTRTEENKNTNFRGKSQQPNRPIESDIIEDDLTED